MKRIRQLDRSSLMMIGGVLALGLTGCSVGESRDAPEDETATEATETAPSEARETRERPEAEAEAARVVPEGTTLVFRVEETVSTGSHEVGDEFTATLAEPALATDGSVALPAGTSSRWVVTQSEDEGGESDRALLAFGLQSVQVDGAAVPIEATVTGTEIQSEAGDTNTESVAKVAVGTAAGAIIGQIIGGDTESTLKGAGVGAVVGTVVALTTRDGEARITPGSTITVRLDESIRAD